MNKERRENLENPIIKVEVILQHCPNIEDEELLNTIVFAFKNQVPGAVHTTEEMKTLDKSYRLKVSVDKKYLNDFKDYLKKENKDIICLSPVEQ